MLAHSLENFRELDLLLPSCCHSILLHLSISAFALVLLCLPDVPKFPKEKIDPIKVEEGQPFILECNPPKGIPPLEIYWMTISE